MTSKKIRVRFAPSPTGPLHIGGVRTALYNYLFAKKNDGVFILRIEDTDQSRYVKGAEEYIVESLKWCNLHFDEGVNSGGEFGPYRQSERKHIYEQYAKDLVKKELAYYAFDTPEELDQMRDRLKESGIANPQYDSKIRLEMNNSIRMGSRMAEIKKQEMPYVIRFKMPDNEMIVINDLIRGKVEVNSSTLDDKILFKSDGMPTYHLANVVDDYLMQISHVIRGEEWLPSTPLHVLLYRSFGWEDKMPEFAHLPLLLKPSGNGKLSKRDGDKMGFPVFPLEWKNPDGEVFKGYREDGYFPEAFVNMLALLGWNPGTEQEIFNLKELEEKFSLSRVNKAGARFDPEKAKWFNQQYLRNKGNKELAVMFQQVLKAKSINFDDAYVERVCGLVKDRVHFVHEFWDQANYFFQPPSAYDPKVVKKNWKQDIPGIISKLARLLEAQSQFNSEHLEEILKSYISENDLPMGKVMNALRLCLVGESKGPHLFDIMEIIGKEETISRLETALKKIGNE